MLKVTFSDTGLCLEVLTQSLETVVAQRMKVNLRLGQPMVVLPLSAAIPVRADLPAVATLMTLAQTHPAVCVEVCDRNWLEVAMIGTWLTSQIDSDEGIFLVELSTQLEAVLYGLWQASQTQSPVGYSRLC